MPSIISLGILSAKVIIFFVFTKVLLNRDKRRGRDVNF